MVWRLREQSQLWEGAPFPVEVLGEHSQSSDGDSEGAILLCLSDLKIHPDAPFLSL